MLSDIGYGVIYRFNKNEKRKLHFAVEYLGKSPDIRAKSKVTASRDGNMLVDLASFAIISMKTELPEPSIRRLTIRLSRII